MGAEENALMGFPATLLVATVLALVTVVLPGLLVLHFHRKRLADHRNRLFTASATQLAAQARDTLVSSRWERFPAAQRVLSCKEAWTERELLGALEAMYEEARDADRQEGLENAREGWGFAFHDSGLASIADVLSARLGDQAGRKVAGEVSA